MIGVSYFYIFNRSITQFLPNQIKLYNINKLKT